MNNPDINKKYRSIGIAFIALGAILIIGRLGIIPWRINVADIIFSWQMILIIVGALLYRGGKKKNMALVLMGMGVFFLVPEVFNLSPTLRAVYWPSFLVFIGVFLLLRHKKRIQEPYTTPSDDEGEPSPPPPPLHDAIDDFVALGSKDVVVSTQNFSGGQSTSVFAGIEYDMRSSVLGSSIVVVECACIFGGIGFRVPAGWKVRNEVKTVLGGVSDDRMQLPDNGSPMEEKTMVLKGVCIFGGIEVKY
ncbi:MAG: LiaF transmembrane domain-containing protein [Mangrovibacterium sp.]